MSESEAIVRLDRLIRQLKDMRAERWLSEWPRGNSERPKMPPHVAEYLAEIEAQKGG